MVRTAAQKIADVLIFLCGFLIFCDILLLPLTPALAYFRFQNPASMRFDHLLAVFAYDFDDGVGNLLEIILKESWKSPETAVLALFLLLAGICGAVILSRASVCWPLWRTARRSPRRTPSTSSGRRRLLCDRRRRPGPDRLHPLPGWRRRIAVLHRFLHPPLHHGGLLCLVMAGLFHRAAEMKAENDLTI